jgi:hypothetical protein
MSRKLFTAGCVVLILLGLVHLLGHHHLMTAVGDTEQERQLLAAMKADTRDMGLGMMRSTFDFFAGFSLTFSVMSLGLGLAGFVVRGHATAAPGLLRQTAIVYAGTWAVMVGVGLRYFFSVPLAFIATVFLLFAAAAATAAPRA